MAGRPREGFTGAWKPPNPNHMLASEAIARFAREKPAHTLDIGAGVRKFHTKFLRSFGLKVTSLDIVGDQDINAEFMSWEPTQQYPAIWCSHMLEHTLDVHQFLRKIFITLEDGGLLGITVPPLKAAMVGGHISLWYAGHLVYRLVLAGFDCSQARVGSYGYNISVIVRKVARPPVELVMDEGDIETLAPYFPIPVKQGTDARWPDINW